MANQKKIRAQDINATGTPSSTTFFRGDNTWSTVSGTGDVVGPASATDNAIARYDGITGKLIQDSVGTLDDTGILSTTSMRVTGTSGTGDLHLRHQATDATATGQATSLFANSSGDIKWKNAGNFYTTLATSANTADRVYTFPDTTGTVALTSNLTGFVPYTGATTNVDLGVRTIRADRLATTLSAAAAQAIFSNGNAGVGSITTVVGVLAEAVATTVSGRAFYGKGQSNGALAGYGGYFISGSTAGTDSGIGFGVRGESTGVRTGSNFGVSGVASGSTTTNIGVLGSVVATAGSTINRGAELSGTTNGTVNATGVHGFGLVGASGDTATAYAGRFTATATHAGGENIAIEASASGGTNSYSFYGTTGTMFNTGPIRSNSTLTAYLWSTNNAQVTLGTLGTFINQQVATVTDQNATPNTVSHGAFNGLGSGTITNSTVAVTYTNASTLYIDKAPVAGTNITITNPYALYVNSGNSFFGGTITASNLSGTNTGDQTITLTGAVTGSGTGTFATTLSSGIDATKIADGSVTSTEFQYINSLTSNAQTQLNSKQGTLTLTTTGTSGAATLVGDTLNIPQYSGGGGGDMTLAGVQTVTGAKTFNEGTLLDKGSIVFDVKAYGAVGNDTADDTTAIQAAVDAAWANGGGTVYFPSGRYKITASIKLYTGTTAYSNIHLVGNGNNIFPSIEGSVIKQYTSGEDGILATNFSAASQSINCSITNLTVQYANATLTTSGNGIYLKQNAAGVPAFQSWNMKGVVVLDFKGANKAGIMIESMTVSTLDTIHVLSCTNGIWFRGDANGANSAISTSTTLLNCYINMNSGGTGDGYRLKSGTYMSFVGCAVDVTINNLSGSGYNIIDSNGISFSGCGAEGSGTVTIDNFWKFDNCIGVTTSGNFSTQSNNTKVYYLTNASYNVTMQGHTDVVSVGGSTGVYLDSTCFSSEIGCKYASATQYVIPGGSVHNIITNQIGKAKFGGTVEVSLDSFLGYKGLDVHTNGNFAETADLAEIRTNNGSDTGNLLTLNGNGSGKNLSIKNNGAETGYILKTGDALLNTVDIGNADTTLSRSAAGVLAVEGVVVPTVSSTNTLTNKRITRRIQSVASSATVTPSWDNDDDVIITALATGLTLANPTGTPTDCQQFVVRIKDNGTARTIAFGANYRAVGVSLPTTTIANKTMYFGCKYNALDSKVDITAYAQEV